MDIISYQYENHLIRRSSIRYIFPPMLGMVFAQIAPVIDGICISGAMGEVALSALSTAAPISYVFNVIAALGGIGCGVVISRCSGAGEKDRAARVFTRGILLMVTITLLLSAGCVIFINPLLKVLCATAENFSYAKEYLLVTLAGAVFPVLNFAGDYILADDNNQNLAMAGDIVGAVVNIVIDFAGVYVFHFGIWVVAFGTVFGSFCCCLVYLLHFRKPDRLCRFVSPKRMEGDPNLFNIIKPGSAAAIMYCMYAMQILFQNYVLREEAGTSGLGNSAVMENLMLVLTIIIAGAANAAFPLASAYCGEQNRSGMLMAKRMLTRIGVLMLLPFVLILCVFPQLAILPYSIDDPVMLQSLPFAIRILSVSSLIMFIDELLIDYLSAIEEEGKANLAYIIQYLVQISLTLLLGRFFPMNAPWYAAMFAGIVLLIFLCFFCNHLSKGLNRFYRENLLLLTGGKLSPAVAESWKSDACGILTEEQMNLIDEKMLTPLLSAVPDGVCPDSSFTILEREDGRRAVILRYASKKDYLEADRNLTEWDEDEDTEVTSDECIRSEFLGTRRLMIVLAAE